MDFKLILIDMVLPVMLKALETYANQGIDNLHLKNKALVDTMLILAERLATAHGAELVAGSANVYDDKALAAALEVIQTEGAKFGITFATVAA